MDQPKHKKAIERKTWHQIPFLLPFACCCWARGRVIRSEGNHKAPERRKTVAKRKRRVEKMKLIISISSRHGIRIHKWFRFDCFDPTAWFCQHRKIQGNRSIRNRCKQSQTGAHKVLRTPFLFLRDLFRAFVKTDLFISSNFGFSF